MRAFSSSTEGGHWTSVTCGRVLIPSNLACLLYAEQQPVATRRDAAIIRELFDKCASQSFLVNLAVVWMSCSDWQELYMLCHWNDNKKDTTVQYKLWYLARGFRNYVPLVCSLFSFFFSHFWICMSLFLHVAVYNNAQKYHACITLASEMVKNV